MDENRRAYLEMLQAVIARQAGNCLQVKSWAVVLVAALFALATKDSNPTFVVIALLPTLVFWGLDAFYLRQERLFKKLYEAVWQGRDWLQVFSMDTRPVAGEVKTWWQTLVARVVWPVYVPIVIILAILFYTLGGWSCRT